MLRHVIFQQLRSTLKDYTDRDVELNIVIELNSILCIISVLFRNIFNN